MRRFLALILSVVFTVSFVVLTAGFADAYGGAEKTFLKTGFDWFENPLTKGMVIWNQPRSGMFQVTYVLVGALPNHTYQVGIHIFLKPGNEDEYWYDFGSEGWEDNPLQDSEWVCREPHEINCYDLNAWEFGFLTTDDEGNGAAHFNLHPNSGTYEIQFTVRQGTCFGDSEEDDCTVVFESGGPFGTTETVIIE